MESRALLHESGNEDETRSISITSEYGSSFPFIPIWLSQFFKLEQSCKTVLNTGYNRRGPRLSTVAKLRKTLQGGGTRRQERERGERYQARNEVGNDEVDGGDSHPDGPLSNVNFGSLGFIKIWSAFSSSITVVTREQDPHAHSCGIRAASQCPSEFLL
jgi:hypothetical protein